MHPEEAEVNRKPFDDDALQSLKDRVLRGTLNVLAVAVPAIGVVVVLSELRDGALSRITVVLTTYTLLFAVLRFASSRLGFRRSALALLGLLALTAFLVEARGGVTVGSTSLNVLVLLLGALFFGRRGAALGLLGVIVLFTLAGFMVVSGLVPPIKPAMWDPGSAIFWIRQCVALALFGVAIGVTEVYVVERLAHEARRLRALAEHEQEQRLALERSEREREHEREQRLAAQKALEESRRIEALARLAGGIAHDFNNALTSIMGTAELLKGNSSPSVELEDHANHIVETARRAGELTRQLLTLGRRQVSKPESVLMAACLTRLSNAFRRVLPSDITLLVEAPAESLTAWVDPAQLERALFNLVINARDAMPRGGKLTLGCRREVAAAGEENLPAGRYAVVTVSDTGEGMAQETLERIFEPFFTTKEPGMGTGLGLATVYAFAKESGGDVRVTSTCGEGATFRLCLPEGVLPAQLDAPSQPPSTLAGTERESVPVLVVEDCSNVRATVVQILRRGGFEVSEAADGDRALSLLAERNDFAVLCIDGVMPGTATSAVIERAVQLAPSMRVLLCSGYLQEDLLRRGVAAGRFAFLQKPFSVEELLRSVRGLLPASGIEATTVARPSLHFPPSKG